MNFFGPPRLSVLVIPFLLIYLFHDLHVYIFGTIHILSFNIKKHITFISIPQINRRPQAFRNAVFSNGEKWKKSSIILPAFMNVSLSQDTGRQQTLASELGQHCLAP